MGLGIARHFISAWKLFTGRAYTPSPNVGPAPLRAAHRAVVAPYGGRLLPDAMRFERSAGGAVAHLSIRAPEGAPVLVLTEVAARAHMPLRLHDGTGALVAEGPLAPGHGMLVGLVAPNGGASQLSVASDKLRDIAWRGADAFVLAPLNLVRLVPQVPLAADVAWTAHYGPVSASDVPGQIRLAAYRALQGPCTIPWIDGLKLDIDPGNELYRAVVLSGLYEPDLMVALRPYLRPGGIFVDVGANVGAFTLFAAARVGAQGQVIAFEPSAREFAQLTRNIAVNALTNVTAHRVAVADTAGELSLRVAEDGHAGHNTIGDAFAYTEVATVALQTVPATTLDIALADLTRCDAIKMDIEGAELRALRGAAQTLRRLRPVLALEINGASLRACGTSAAEVMAFLAAANYQACDIDPATGTLRRDCRIEPEASKNIIALPA